MSTFLNENELLKFEAENKEYYFDSNFKFLLSHYGPRPKELHGIIGTTGSGKSTLARALIVDFAKAGNIFIWLSEESTKRYSEQLNALTRDERILENIHLYSELSLKNSYKKSIDCFFDQFEERSLLSKPKLIFIDNITTSIMYDDTFGFAGQSRSVERLRKFADIANVPIFYITHTRKGVSDNQKLPIELEDVRGSAQIINTSAYVYILQRFKVKDKFFPCLHVRKHRYHDVPVETFLLEYENRTYACDYPLTWDQYNEIFKTRNVLG